MLLLWPRSCLALSSDPKWMSGKPEETPVPLPTPIKVSDDGLEKFCFLVEQSVPQAGKIEEGLLDIVRLLLQKTSTSVAAERTISLIVDACNPYGRHLHVAKSKSLGYFLRCLEGYTATFPKVCFRAHQDPWNHFIKGGDHC